MLFAFRKILVSSPTLLDVLRAEGVWDLIFSENFFYFWPASAECFVEYCKYDEVPPWNLEIYSSSNRISSELHGSEVDILQIEAISFVEFAATLNDSSHNLVGSSFFYFVVLSILNICSFIDLSMFVLIN